MSLLDEHRRAHAADVARPPTGDQELHQYPPADCSTMLTSTRTPHRQRPLIEIEGWLVQIQLRSAAAPHPEACHRTGHLLEVPGEVLTATRLTGVGQRVGRHRLDGMRHDLRRAFLVDHRRHTAVIVQRVLDAKRREQARNNFLHKAFHAYPGLPAGRSYRAGQRAGLRDRIGRDPPALAAPPHTITVECRGSTRLDSTPPGRPVISVPMPYTRSDVRCGRDVWPPGECITISIESAADVIGPGMTATRPPTARRGSQCRAKIRETPPTNAPAAIASIAPPGISSSAAWNTSRTPRPAVPAPMPTRSRHRSTSRCVRRVRTRARCSAWSSCTARRCARPSAAHPCRRAARSAVHARVRNHMSARSHRAAPWD